jgi:hypothetical protein
MGLSFRPFRLGLLWPLFRSAGALSLPRRFFVFACLPPLFPSCPFFVLPCSRPSLFCPSFLPLRAVPPGGGAHTTGGLLRPSAAPPRPQLLPLPLSSCLPLSSFSIYIEQAVLLQPRTKFCTGPLVGFLPKRFLPTPSVFVCISLASSPTFIPLLLVYSPRGGHFVITLLATFASHYVFHLF